MIKKRVTENDDATAECLSTSSPVQHRNAAGTQIPSFGGNEHIICCENYWLILTTKSICNEIIE